MHERRRRSEKGACTKSSNSLCFIEHVVFLFSVQVSPVPDTRYKLHRHRTTMYIPLLPWSHVKYMNLSLSFFFRFFQINHSLVHKEKKMFDFLC